MYHFFTAGFSPFLPPVIESGLRIELTRSARTSRGSHQPNTIRITRLSPKSTMPRKVAITATITTTAIVPFTISGCGRPGDLLELTLDVADERSGACDPAPSALPSSPSRCHSVRIRAACPMRHPLHRDPSRFTEIMIELAGPEGIESQPPGFGVRCTTNCATPLHTRITPDRRWCSRRSAIPRRPPR